jgi:hypothetical protein
VPFPLLGLFAVVCLVLGVRRRGVLPPWLLALSLFAPLTVSAWALQGPRPYGGVVAWLMLAAGALLVLGALGTRRGWSASGTFTIAGLALPLVMLLPLLGFLYGLLSGQTLD